MEKSSNLKGRDPESVKLLCKYQYAFLTMQKYYTSLIKTIRNLNQKSLLKSLRHWKHCSNLSLIPHLSTLFFALKSSEFKFFLMKKAKLTKYFYLIISFSNLKQDYDVFLENYKKEKEKSQIELKNMDLEVKTLKMNQAELEIITNYYSKSEGVRQKVKGSVKNLVKELISENFELERQIEEMNRKTVELFEEMNFMLDVFEHGKKGKGKKSKKKINMSNRKSYMPISY